MALGSWFSQIWRAAGPEIAAAAAIASGNPELAVPASQAAAATIKPKTPSAPVAPPVPVTPPGFLAAYRSLPPADREVLTVGGAVLGSVILYKLLFSHHRVTEGSAGHG